MSKSKKNESSSSKEFNCLLNKSPIFLVVFPQVFLGRLPQLRSGPADLVKELD